MDQQVLSPSPSQRDPRYDIIRGIALFAIMINHTHLKELTSSYQIIPPFFFNFGDVFVWVSGCSVALAYSGMIEQQRFGAVWWKVFKRCLQILIGIIITTLVGMLIVRVFNGLMPSNQSHFGMEAFLNQPVQSLIELLQLKRFPAFFGVMLLYLFFLPIAPILIYLAQRCTSILLFISLGIHLYAQYLPDYGHLYDPFKGFAVWHHPLAYQLVFILGIQTGVWVKNPDMAWQSTLKKIFPFLWLPLIYLAVIYYYHRDNPGMYRYWRPEYCGILRVLGLELCVGTLAVITHGKQEYLKYPVFGIFERCGQKSLRLFCIGAMMSYLLLILKYQFLSTGPWYQMAAQWEWIITHTAMLLIFIVMVTVSYTPKKLKYLSF